MIDGDALRRMRQALGDEGAPSTPSCPPAQRIWQASVGELGPGEVREVLDHVAGCAHCAWAWKLAVELDRDSPAVEDEDAVVVAAAAARPANTGWIWAGVAVAAVALFALTVPTLLPPPADPGPWRAGEVSQIRTTVERLPRDAFVLRWEGAPEQVRFEVTVTTEDLRVLHRVTELEQPELLVPASSLDEVPDGGVVLWRVELVRADGTRTTGGAFATTVGP